MALEHYVERYQALQSQQETSNQLIKDILFYANDIENALRDENRRLKKDLEDAHLDLDDARRSRREMQQKLSIVNQQVNQYNIDNEGLKNRNPYVMVLVDGDGTIFHEELIKQGLDGGKKAANALRNAVLEEYTDLSEDVEVIAKVCANFTGLVKAMTRDGSLDSYDDFRDFTLGFTQGKASFDFIDVGHGKERADSKIKELARWNLRNHNCKHILLGVSHDAGYAPFLDEVLRDESITRRVTIIEGSPIVRELSKTGVRIINFDHIFRNEKLIERQPSITQTQQHQQKQQQAEILSMPTSNRTSPTPPSTWAGVTSTPLTTPAPLVFPVTVKTGAAATAASSTIITPHPKINWNPGPRGLDTPLNISMAVLSRIKLRTGSNKLCNNHYLRGPCTKPDCQFEHNYKITDEDIKAISYLTRLNPCTNGQDCDSEWCIYGHHCPSWGLDLSKVGGVKGEEGVCPAFSCRFGKEAHPPGTVIKHPKKWEKEKDYSY